MQLLDGSKAEQYEIPIEIKAELRQYQRDGVSWLAFLAKYQLHGILCDGELPAIYWCKLTYQIWDSASHFNRSVSSVASITNEQ